MELTVEFVERCCAVLDGDTGSLDQLRAYLAAVGHHKAGWVARRVRQSLDHRLHIVLEVLPPELCRQLMYEFCDHVLPHWRKRYPYDPRPFAALDAFGRWLRGEIDGDALAGFEESLRQAILDVRRERHAAKRGRAQARGAASALYRAFTVRNSNEAAWRVSSDAAWSASGYDVPMCFADIAGYQAERRWQVDRIRSLLMARAPGRTSPE